MSSISRTCSAWLAGLIRGTSLRVDRYPRLPGAFRGGARALHTLFERTHDGKILVQPEAIGRADLCSQAAGVSQNQIQQKRIGLRRVGLLARRRAEEALIYCPRIQLSRQRSGRIAPSNVRSVNPRVSHRQIDTNGDRRYTQFQRRQRRLIGHSLSRDLVHRNAVAEIRTRRLPNGRAGEDRRLLRVVPVADLGAGIEKIAHNHQAVFEVAQRFKRRRQSEIAPAALWRPFADVHPVGHVEYGQANRTLRHTWTRQTRTMESSPRAMEGLTRHPFHEAVFYAQLTFSRASVLHLTVRRLIAKRHTQHCRLDQCLRAVVIILHLSHDVVDDTGILGRQPAPKCVP